MRNYLAPDYKNEEIMSGDIITDSAITNATQIGETGVYRTIYNDYDEETGEFLGEKVSYSYSVSNFFKTNN